MTAPENTSTPAPGLRPGVRPDFVPEGRSGNAESTSSPVPISSIGDEVEQPAALRPHTSSQAPCPAATAAPWFELHQITWTYPQHTTERTTLRHTPCPTCGAPSQAHCVTRSGKTTPMHGRRARAANGICCRGIGSPIECPRGLKR